MRARLLEPWLRLRALPRPVWIACLTTFINRMGTMALPFLTLFLTQQRHYSESAAGLAVSSYGLTGLLTSPYAGRLIDRLGPARLMLWALVASGVVMVVIPFIPNYAAIVGAIVIWAAFNEGVRPATFALLTDSVPSSGKRNAITLYRTSLNLGMSVGPALGGLLAAVSFSWVFGVDALTSWIAAAFLLRAMRWMPRHVQTAAHARSVVWSDKALWRYLAAMLPVMIVFFQHTSTMPLFMVRTLHLGPSAYGLSFSINTGLVLLFEIPINSVTNHWPYRRSLSLGALLISAGFGALGLCSGFWSVALAVTVFTFGEMLLLPAAAAYLTDLAPPGRSGEYVGMQNGLISLSMLLAPAIGTVVLQRYGGVAVWTAMGALGSISVVSLMTLPSVMRR